MRRTDREITDFSQIVEIMKRCEVCHISFSNEYPYVVPMNFGMKIDGEEITLYFHGADVGKKHDLIKKNNKVGFVMENMLSVLTYDIACKSVAEYESVMGYGKIKYADDNEKLEALELLMNQYAKPSGEKFEFEPEAVKHTCIIKLKVENLSAKRLIINK